MQSAEGKMRTRLPLWNPGGQHDLAWLLALSVAAVGSWVFALALIANSNAFP
jgi:hypothetical protein